MKRTRKLLSVILATLMIFTAAFSGAVTALAFNPNNYKPDFTQLKFGAPVTGTDGKKYLPVTCFFTSSEDLSDQHTVEALEADVTATLKDGTKAESVKGNGMTLIGPLNKDDYATFNANAFMWSWSEGSGEGEVKFNLPLLENGDTQSVEKSLATGLEEVNGLKVGDSVTMQLETVFKNDIPADILPGGSYELKGNKVTFKIEEDSSYPKTVPVTDDGETPAAQSVKDAKVSVPAVTYNEKAQTPDVKVELGGVTLKKGTDYTVTYADNKNAGTGMALIKGIGNYTDSKVVYFKIKKAKNPLTVKGKKIKVKASKLADKKVTLKKKKIYKLSDAKGKLTFSKKSGNKLIRINKKTGSLIIKKGTPKGTYKVKVKVKAAGNKNYGAKTKTVTITIKVV